MRRMGFEGLMAVLAVAAAMGAGAVRAAEAAAALPQSGPMPYAACLSEIATVTGQLGVEPEIVEDSPGLHVVRFDTPTGRVVLGCSAEAGALVVATGH